MPVHHVEPEPPIRLILCQFHDDGVQSFPQGDVPVSAQWELRLLGVDTPAKLAQLHDAPKRRRVQLAVVGQGVVSASKLGDLDSLHVSVTYHGCADPGKGTHDTGQVRVILALTSALGVGMDVHVWKPGRSFSEVANAFRAAAGTADIVVLFQSFWGPTAQEIATAIRDSEQALFVSPYVEHGGRPTSECPQGSACKPWVPGNVGHFVLAVPLARRNSNGAILSPSDRGPTDSEAINFIAPSYHASGKGGTCPAGAVTAACCAFLYSLTADDPTPAAVVEILRATSDLDRSRLAAVDEFDVEAVERLTQQVRVLRNPEGGVGVLGAYRHKYCAVSDIHNCYAEKPGLLVHTRATESRPFRSLRVPCVLWGWWPHLNAFFASVSQPAVGSGRHTFRTPAWWRMSSACARKTGSGGSTSGMVSRCPTASYFECAR